MHLYFNHNDRYLLKYSKIDFGRLLQNKTFNPLNYSFKILEYNTDENNFSTFVQALR